MADLAGGALMDRSMLAMPCLAVLAALTIPSLATSRIFNMVSCARAYIELVG